MKRWTCLARPCSSVFDCRRSVSGGVGLAGRGLVGLRRKRNIKHPVECPLKNQGVEKEKHEEPQVCRQCLPQADTQPRGIDLAIRAVFTSDPQLFEQPLLGGQLVPYRPEVRLAGARYTLVCVPGRERQPAVRAFSEWLLGQGAR